MKALPRIAYVSLWLPLPSETFIFREILNLRAQGYEVSPYSVYGPTRKKLDLDMAEFQNGVTTHGIKSLGSIARAFGYWRRRSPETSARLWKTLPFLRWTGLESAGENLWCLAAGFHLARLFEENEIGHIHAPWASGPATTAMAASRLTGIPFSFSARAADIHPPDGSLPVKMRAAAFVRVNTAANQTYLTEIAPDCADKIHLVYNGMTLPNPPLRDDPPPAPPYRLLALGRFTPKKGFDVLLDACALLKRQGFPFHLTLAGSGGQAIRLKAKRARLGLAGQVSMPGSICHSEVSGLMNRHHAFIMPSIVADSGDRDGIPNVIIEALCHRMPVIATDAGGISEVIQDGKTGLLRPQRDPAALAEAIAGLFMNPTQAAAMATAGNKLVQALFDGENNTRQLAALFIGHAR